MMQPCRLLRLGFGFFMTVRYNCSWQQQLLQRGRWPWKKLIMEFTFNMAEIAILARNCSCLDCLTVCYIRWTCRTYRKVTAEHAKQDGQCCRVPVSWKSLSDILRDTEKND